MLASLRVRDLRGFADTGWLPLGRINVFIGPNNAGKSTILSAIELLVRSQGTYGWWEPLRFDEMPAFASFSSVLRRSWARGKPRPARIVLDAMWDEGRRRGAGTGARQRRGIWSQVECGQRDADGATQVMRASYGDVADTPILSVVRRVGGADRGQFAIDGVGGAGADIYFQGLFPLPLTQVSRKGLGKLQQAFVDQLIDPAGRFRGRVVTLHPHRPVPRSVYVVDDPNLSEDDRSLISHLLALWADDTPASKLVRGRIVASLQTLGLATDVQVVQKSRTGPRIAEVRVATSGKRQQVSLADVGFGVSQVLPLVTREASLGDGTLIAYQPEVHLHPYAQSRLADLFAASLTQGNDVFIETHSPDLVLRLQYLVSSGRLSASDVRVFCVEAGASGSMITPVRFSEAGVPQPRWPRGFLDTSLNLARDIGMARFSNAAPPRAVSET